MTTYVIAESVLFPTRNQSSAATLCVHEPRVEPVNAASPLAKAAELCYVNVGDGKQQLPALLSPFSLQCGAFCSHCSLCPWKRDPLLLEVLLRNQQKISTRILKLQRQLLYV